MKSLMVVFILILICLFSPNLTISQDQCGNTEKITTNPENPVNEKDTYPKTKLNNFFDWRVEAIPIYCNAPYQQGISYILSPFWDSDALYKEKVFKEYKPEDGWELLKVKRGYVDKTVLDQSNQPVSVPNSFSLNQAKSTPDGKYQKGVMK